MSSTGKPGSVSPLCIHCRYPMPVSGYISMPSGEHTKVNHCINKECIRYGLLTIVHEPGTGER